MGGRADRRKRWRDVRLWGGVAMLVGSMFAGAHVLSSGEQTVTVWRATRDLAVGDPPQLEPITVRLADSTGAYLTTDALPQGRVRIPVAQGALLPAAAIEAAESGAERLVTVAVGPMRAPIGLSAGDVVDVWAGAEDSALPPSLVLPEVHVHEVDYESIGVGGEIPVVLSVSKEQAVALVSASRGVISLVEVPLGAQSSSTGP